MLRMVIVSAGLAVAGCATSVMDGYIGQPLQAAMARYGEPSLVFDMPDGRRAFQWEMTSTGTMPRITQGSVNVYAPPGSFGSANYNQTTFGGNVVTNTCRYTMYAEWRANAWVFTGYEKPSLSCL